MSVSCCAKVKRDIMWAPASAEKGRSNGWSSRTCSAKLATASCPTSSRESAPQIRASASHANPPAPVLRIDSESSTHSITWYCRLAGLVRRSQILSLRYPEAMYGITLRIEMRLPPELLAQLLRQRRRQRLEPSPELLAARHPRRVELPRRHLAHELRVHLLQHRRFALHALIRLRGLLPLPRGRQQGLVQWPDEPRPVGSFDGVSFDRPRLLGRLVPVGGHLGQWLVRRRLPAAPLGRLFLVGLHLAHLSRSIWPLLLHRLTRLLLGQRLGPRLGFLRRRLGRVALLQLLVRRVGADLGIEGLVGTHELKVGVGGSVVRLDLLVARGRRLGPSLVRRWRFALDQPQLLVEGLQRVAKSMVGVGLWPAALGPRLLRLVPPTTRHLHQVAPIWLAAVRLRGRPARPQAGVGWLWLVLLLGLAILLLRLPRRRPAARILKHLLFVVLPPLRASRLILPILGFVPLRLCVHIRRRGALRGLALLLLLRLRVGVDRSSLAGLALFLLLLGRRWLGGILRPGRIAVAPFGFLAPVAHALIHLLRRVLRHLVGAVRLVRLLLVWLEIHVVVLLVLGLRLHPALPLLLLRRLLALVLLRLRGLLGLALLLFRFLLLFRLFLNLVRLGLHRDVVAGRHLGVLLHLVVVLRLQLLVLVLVPQPLVHHLLILLVQLAHPVLGLLPPLLLFLAPLFRLFQICHLPIKVVGHLNALFLFGAVLLLLRPLGPGLATRLLLLGLHSAALQLTLLLELLAHVLLALALAHPARRPRPRRPRPPPAARCRSPWRRARPKSPAAPALAAQTRRGARALGAAPNVPTPGAGPAAAAPVPPAALPPCSAPRWARCRPASAAPLALHPAAHPPPGRVRRVAILRRTGGHSSQSAAPRPPQLRRRAARPARGGAALALRGAHAPPPPPPLLRGPPAPRPRATAWRRRQARTCPGT
eukprot:scaffold1394_cov109-Isochrysis_galbana.AAC.19